MLAQSDRSAVRVDNLKDTAARSVANADGRGFGRNRHSDRALEGRQVMLITRRSVAVGGALAFLRPAQADTVPLVLAARQEGSLTWYVAQQDTSTAEKFGRAFTAAHPGISVEVIRTTGQVAFQRLMLDIKNHTPHCDVFSATDISHMPILKERHELTQFTPINSA